MFSLKIPTASPHFLIASVGGRSKHAYPKINWIVQWKLF